MCRWFHWRALYLFYPHQFYKKGYWFICMLFRWAFPSTKGSYSCTWLALKGISRVGVYLVCLPWFKKSCFKSETVFLHFFGSCQPFSCFLSLSHSVILIHFSLSSDVQVFFPIVEQTCWSVKYSKKAKWIKWDKWLRRLLMSWAKLCSLTLYDMVHSYGFHLLSFLQKRI